MHVVVLGGTGHIGTWLVPQLVATGHDVSCVSRGLRQPYQPNVGWKQVRRLTLDRAVEEASGNFGASVAALQPDVVIDLTCFEVESARQLAEALRGRIQQLLHCGTIWVHGHSVEVPTQEDAPKLPFENYGKQKLAIEQYLHRLAREQEFPVTILHPGHLVGPGWNPVNPAGNFNPAVFATLAAGEELMLPNLGMETLHHVHAADVAAAFVAAIEHRIVALGESFHVVSGAALTLRGYAETMAAWFGQPARLRFLPWEQWRTTVSTQDAEATWDHIAHSPNCSIEKARRLLAYSPRYGSVAAVQEAISWMRDQNGAIV